MSVLLALALLAAPAGPPSAAGVFRRAVAASDGNHLAVFLYVPERPLPGAPAVLLVPDLGTTHDVYDVNGLGLARELCDRGLTVLSFDWRGTGYSQLPAGDSTLDDLVALDLPTAASALGPERPLVIVGWGWGGALAYAAAAGPLRDRVRGVVALNAVVQPDVPNLAVERIFAQHGAIDLQRELASPAPQRRGSLFDLLWVHGATLDDELGSAVLSRGLTPISAAEATQLDGWMHAGKTTLGGKAYPELLRDLRAPVLAMFGMADNWTHPEFASGVRDFLPAAQLTLRPLTTFEGYRDDPGHLGLVLGETSRRQLVPVIFDFIVAQGAGR